MKTISSKEDIYLLIEITKTRVSAKRARLNTSSDNYLIKKIGRKIWNKNPNKARSKKSKDREFRETFECGINITAE